RTRSELDELDRSNRHHRIRRSKVGDIQTHSGRVPRHERDSEVPKRLIFSGNTLDEIDTLPREHILASGVCDGYLHATLFELQRNVEHVICACQYVNHI